MDATEAISWMNAIKITRNDTECGTAFWKERKGINEAIDTALSALEKQVGRKPVGTHYAHMKCPACNHRIPSGMGSSSRRRDNWCNYCGQKIDWSVT